MLGDLGAHRAFLKHTAEDESAAAAYLGAFLVIKAVLGLVLLLAFVVLPFMVGPLSSWTGGEDPGWAYDWMALFHLTASVVAVPSLVLAARRETARLATMTTCATAAGSLARIVVALAHLGAAALAATFALQALVALVAGVVMIRRRPVARPHRFQFGGLLGYAGPMLVLTCAG